MELVDRPDKALKYFQEMTLKDIQPAAVVSFYASSIARTIKFPWAVLFIDLYTWGDVDWGRHYFGGMPWLIRILTCVLVIALLRDPCSCCSFVEQSDHKLCSKWPCMCLHQYEDHEWSSYQHMPFRCIARRVKWLMGMCLRLFFIWLSLFIPSSSTSGRSLSWYPWEPYDISASI